ncbi:unnamed protein product, partial [Phaeothamnion confervicola]
SRVRESPHSSQERERDRQLRRSRRGAKLRTTWAAASSTLAASSTGSSGSESARIPRF